MRKILLLITFCFISFPAILLAQAETKQCTLFDEIELLKHVKSLSSQAFEGRRTGTKGAVKARKYIINQFHALQVKPLGKSFEEPFFFVKKKNYEGVNVLGLVEGTKFPKKYIVISAHYDHEGIKNGKIYHGADDNASGLSALFAFAEYFKKNPPQHSVILAAFDSEELGLQGSKYFVKNTKIPYEDLLINLNMDMISRSDKNELYVAGTSENKKLKYLMSNFNYSCNIKLLTGHDGYDGLDNWTYASDHANFHKQGVPFLYFGVEDHKDYHEPSDTFENIHPEFYVEAVKTIIEVFKKVDQSNL
ncbi:M28 family peptidase [Algibacter luteus]|uniref:Peptidase family M28 n=1 Tax=Algibacter luteus TaxID=1178825 RepID=A0A1M6AXV0_9FLAO|nr:M28 family peptidase [Algibacter luteus]SHI41324.1 Peptidase family M28 [Algibacter luteus]